MKKEKEILENPKEIAEATRSYNALSKRKSTWIKL